MDPGVSELDSDPQNQDPEVDPVLLWAPSGRRLISGLLGLNLVLLGAALVAGEAFNPEGLKHEEPEVFLLVLMGSSLVWMLWYLLWARKQPGICPHKDHHAGGTTVIGKLLSMLIKTNCVCLGFLTVSLSYLHAVFSVFIVFACCSECRSGLMVILSADLLLWLNAVTEDSIHVEIELEKQDNLCNDSAACLAFRKGFEILYPFNIEFYLMAGCMIYVVWKNVGRRTSPDHHHADEKFSLQVLFKGGIIFGLVFGGLVLIAGIIIFVLYQIWVSDTESRLTAFLVFYGYHLAIMPIMSLCSLAGVLVHRLERRAHEGGHNPTRSLDVMLLVAAALGQLALSYFSLVAAIAVGTQGPLGDLDLSYSILSLLELILQNIFIIEGLHRHPSLKKLAQEEKKTDISLLEGNTSAPPAAQEHDGKKAWIKRATQEICAFLILSNIMLWVIPAFGVHPQFENGLGKQFFGFGPWFVLVNLGQPLGVFYRMHSVAALMELLISA
uniref:Otopetrin 3 n=1 Tax=Acanthochromis polyacanthus TaxID=80966 RepID=A0A3Q1EN22_9TELE